VVTPYDVAALLKHETKSWITLFTCKNYDIKQDTYHARTIVRAVLVDVK
jgi:sortase (surface protein transpeptidase)